MIQTSQIRIKSNNHNYRNILESSLGRLLRSNTVVFTQIFGVGITIISAVVIIAATVFRLGGSDGRPLVELEVGWAVTPIRSSVSRRVMVVVGIRRGHVNPLFLPLADRASEDGGGAAVTGRRSAEPGPYSLHYWDETAAAASTGGPFWWLDLKGVVCSIIRFPSLFISILCFLFLSTLLFYSLKYSNTKIILKSASISND